MADTKSNAQQSQISTEVILTTLNASPISPEKRFVVAWQKTRKLEIKYFGFPSIDAFLDDLHDRVAKNHSGDDSMWSKLGFTQRGFAIKGQIYIVPSSLNEQVCKEISDRFGVARPFFKAIRKWSKIEQEGNVRLYSVEVIPYVRKNFDTADMYIHTRSGLMLLFKGNDIEVIGSTSKNKDGSWNPHSCSLDPTHVQVAKTMGWVLSDNMLGTPIEE